MIDSPAEETAADSASLVQEEPSGGGIDPWQLADAILERMNVTDSHAIDEMIHRRALSSGCIIAGLLLFWWLVFIRFESTTFTDEEMILKLDYGVISAMLPFLVFAGTILNMMSRELGRPGPGTLAGFLLLISAYFIIEPIGMYAFGQTEAELGTVLWLCLRLAIIGAGVYAGSHLLIEAFLLSWVKRFLDMHQAAIQVASDADQPVEALKPEEDATSEAAT